MKYEISSSNDYYSLFQLLDDKVGEYNAKKTGRDDGRYFSRIVRCEDNDIIGGIAGWTWAGVCEITHLWIDESHRGEGIGKMLLARAEEEAKSRHCRLMLVRSFSFQAPGFYEKNGFQTKQIITDFPEGFLYHTLTKEI